MGSGNHEVVDVSSDEEVDNFDWLNDLSSDSTDVVEVLSEMKGSVDSQFRKPNSSVQALDDDDDCVILDGDPDKTAKTAAAYAAAVDDDDYKLAKDDDDDEVLVVGQKGEIACRDFPHPRHSCAKYSFNSTSHEKYCDMCHCYVCDIPAPCPHWCVAAGSTDHCHANDKEKIWRNQREYFRTGNMPTHSQPSAKPLPASARQISLSPIPNIIRLSQNHLPGNMSEIRPCSSSSTRVANLSNIRARHRVWQSANGLQPLISGRSNLIRKGNNLRSRVASSGTRYNNIKVGLYTNANVSQSTHHISSVVSPPAITAEMYAQQQQQQQRSSQVNVPDYRAAVTGSQSNVYTQHSGQSKSVGGNCQFQANAGLFAPPETPFTTGGLQAQTVLPQPPGSNENVLQTKLSEVESWLMDSSIQAGLVSPLREPVVGEDNVCPLTFDFETFLND